MNSVGIRDVDELAALIDRDAAERQLTEWQKDRDTLDAKIARQQALLDLLPVTAMQTLVQPEHTATENGAVKIPSPRRAGAHIRALILDAMSREPDREWSTDELRSMLAAAGVPVEDTGTPLRRYLYDLRKHGKIVAVRMGVHRAKRPGEGPQELGETVMEP